MAKLQWFEKETMTKVTKEVNKLMMTNGRKVIKAAQTDMRKSSGLGKSLGAKKKLKKGRIPPSAPGESPHVQTGRLYRMFTIQKVQPGNRWRIKNKDQKAHLLELGTKKMLPRPYFKNAIREVFGPGAVILGEKQARS